MCALEILDDLFFIERGYLNGNHFVYRSDAPVLVDTGYLADFEETEKQISALGVDTSRVRLIVNTHCHCDHVGGNRIIQWRSACEIAMHKIGKYFIDTHDAWATWWAYYVQEADFFECTRGLDDGETILIGPHEFEVMHTPGHAADGIVLYHRKGKVLISSDTLWENDVAVMTLRVEGSSAVFSMMESLERLEALDVNVVYPGHGRPFTEIRSALSRAKKKFKGYLEDRRNIGNDLIKKIIIYTLMMKRTVDEDAFFPYLMSTPWFVETVDLYFDRGYERKYAEVMESFHRRGVVRRKDGRIFTTVKP